MTDDIKNRWLGKLTRLNPATGRGACHGKAPHKLLLLLALISPAECGEPARRSFTRSPGLVLRFRSYGSVVAERRPTRLETCQSRVAKMESGDSTVSIDLTPFLKE